MWNSISEHELYNLTMAAMTAKEPETKFVSFWDHTMAGAANETAHFKAIVDRAQIFNGQLQKKEQGHFIDVLLAVSRQLNGNVVFLFLPSLVRAVVYGVQFGRILLNCLVNILCVVLHHGNGIINSAILYHLHKISLNAFGVELLVLEQVEQVLQELNHNHKISDYFSR